LHDNTCKELALIQVNFLEENHVAVAKQLPALRHTLDNQISNMVKDMCHMKKQLSIEFKERNRLKEEVKKLQNTLFPTTPRKGTPTTTPTKFTPVKVTKFTPVKVAKFQPFSDSDDDADDLALSQS
jgi:hypothetical protein